MNKADVILSVEQLIASLRVCADDDDTCMGCYFDKFQGLCVKIKVLDVEQEGVCAFALGRIAADLLDKLDDKQKKQIKHIKSRHGFTFEETIKTLQTCSEHEPCGPRCPCDGACQEVTAFAANLLDECLEKGFLHDKN